MHQEWTSHEYGAHAGEELAQKDGASVIACTACGFSHVVPLPSKAVLQSFYEKAFYQSEKPDYLNRNSEDMEWRSLEFSDRFQLAGNKMAPELPKRVLDIGCGPGDFLATGLAQGWDCVGVEPSPVASDFARSRGLEIINAPFDQSVADSLEPFSFIHMSEVLEHIPNPRELLETAIGLLAPGGVLCVSVPNDFNALQQAFCNETEADRWWIVPDHHLNYFDFTSLTQLIEGAGLKPFARSTNFPMELFLLMGLDYTSDPALGKQLHGQRKSFDMTLARHQGAARQQFYQALADANLGRLAIVFAVKP